MQASRYIGSGMAVTLLALLTACGSAPPDPTEAGEELVVGQMLDIDYDEDRVICRRQRVFGSHVPKTVCKTESQIAAEREAAQKSIGPLRPMTGTLQRDRALILTVDNRGSTRESDRFPTFRSRYVAILRMLLCQAGPRFDE